MFWKKQLSMILEKNMSFCKFRTSSVTMTDFIKAYAGYTGCTRKSYSGMHFFRKILHESLTISEKKISVLAEDASKLW